MRLLRPLSAALALLCLGLALSAGVASAKSTDAEVQKGLEGLIASPGGPPGAIATLYRNGVYSAVRESIAQPGKHYLYVQPTASTQLFRALEQDESPAAQMYRKYGNNAIYHMHDLLPEGQKPMQVIGNRDAWKRAERKFSSHGHWSSLFIFSECCRGSSPTTY